VTTVSTGVDTHGSNPYEVVVVLAAVPADRAATVAWCERVRSMLLATPGAVVICDVRQVSGSAADVVEALARLRLVVHGCGGQIRLRQADPALLALLALLGFADLLPPCPQGQQ
jgi:hypothetical protein